MGRHTRMITPAVGLGQAQGRLPPCTPIFVHLVLRERQRMDRPMSPARGARCSPCFDVVSKKGVKNAGIVATRMERRGDPARGHASSLDSHSHPRPKRRHPRAASVRQSTDGRHGPRRRMLRWRPPNRIPQSVQSGCPFAGKHVLTCQQVVFRSIGPFAPLRAAHHYLGTLGLAGMSDGRSLEEFKAAVKRGQIAILQGRGRRNFNDLVDSELDVVEAKFRMRKAPAAKYDPNTNKTHRQGWKATWLHAWLVDNAQRYGFYPLSTEVWHWDYR